MKRRLKICIVLAVAAIAGTIYTIKNTVCNRASSQSYALIFDTILSNKSQEIIKEYVANYVQLHDREKSACIANHMLDKFPFLGSVELARSNAKLFITMHSAHAWMDINESFVIVDSGRVVAKDYFDLVAINHLPAIISSKPLHDGDRLNEYICAMLADIPTNIFDNYEIVWSSEYELFLRDKNQNNFFMLADAQSIVLPQKIIGCKLIMENLQATGAFTKKQIPTYIADMRFKNQIVLSSHVGGA